MWLAMLIWRQFYVDMKQLEDEQSSKLIKN